MTKQYLDKSGLNYFWSKVKSYVDNHSGGGGGGSSADSQIEVITNIDTTLPSDSTDYEEGQKICIVDSSTDVYKVYTAINGSWDSGVYLDRAKFYMLINGNLNLSFNSGLYGVGYNVGVTHGEFLYYYAPTSTGITQSTVNTFKDLDSGTYLINASTFIYPTKIRTSGGSVTQQQTLNIGSDYYYLSIYKADIYAYVPSVGDTFMIMSPTYSAIGKVTGTSGATTATVTWDVTTGLVDLTSNQTISGVKTFSSAPVCATQPTANDELANKAYVDAVRNLMKFSEWTNLYSSGNNYVKYRYNAFMCEIFVFLESAHTSDFTAGTLPSACRPSNRTDQELTGTGLNYGRVETTGAVVLHNENGYATGTFTFTLTN